MGAIQGLSCDIRLSQADRASRADYRVRRYLKFIIPFNPQLAKFASRFESRLGIRMPLPSCSRRSRCSVSASIASKRFSCTVPIPSKWQSQRAVFGSAPSTSTRAETLVVEFADKSVHWLRLRKRAELEHRSALLISEPEAAHVAAAGIALAQPFALFVP